MARTAGGAGVHRRRDASRTRRTSWRLAQPDPRLGDEVRSGRLRQDAEAAGLLQEYEAKIAALERMVGRQALEIEFLKGALKNAPRPRSATPSVISGPKVFPSAKDAV